MLYIATNIGCDELGSTVENIQTSIFGRIMFWVLKLLNDSQPLMESKYNLIRLWWIEVDEISYLPIREIGLDVAGNPIVAAPYGEYCGLWVDAKKPFLNPYQFQRVSTDEFERKWKRFEISWKQQVNKSAP